MNKKRQFLAWVLALSLSLIWCEAAFSQTATLEWAKRYNGPTDGYDVAQAMVRKGSYIYVTGLSTSANGKDYLTIKYGAGGTPLWVKRYDGPAHKDDEPAAIAVDGAGNVYVTGASAGSDSVDYLTVKYGPDGTFKWARRYNGPAKLSDRASAIAVTSTGDVYVTGTSDQSINNMDYLTIKYDTNGVRKWVKRYNKYRHDTACSVAVDGGGNVYVTGGSESPGWDGNLIWDYLTIKYDSSGVKQWEKRYNGPRDDFDVAYKVARGPDGNIYVTGASQQLTGDYRDCVTIKYTPAGDVIWTKRYNAPQNLGEAGYDLAFDSDGNVYISGTITQKSDHNNADYLLLSYGPSGSFRWAKRYNGPADKWDSPDGIAVDSGGNIYVTGRSDGSFGSDFATLSYDSAGNLRWVKRYNGTANLQDGGVAIAVDGAKNVYVTGYSQSSNDFDFLTLKYSQP